MSDGGNIVPIFSGKLKDGRLMPLALARWGSQVLRKKLADHPGGLITRRAEKG